MLVVCCGLLAKWLRIRVRVKVWVRIRARGRDCTRCISFLFFSCSVISVVNTFVFVGTVSARRARRSGRRVTYAYSIDDVTATRTAVNKANPIGYI